jgi:hypothetical protein
VAEPATPEPAVQRRRSTRIARTVPLTIRGVDLLSQPFEERTTTLSFNTFGCRYPSRHHLPKNTWVTLEVPASEAAEGRRRVRARVVWIQKPRSVRELFQVSVELEAPGNIWSLDGPPDDWSMADSRFAAAIEEDRKAADVITSWLQPGETLAVVPDAPARDRPTRKLETPVSEIFERDREVSKGNGADEPPAPAFGFAGAAAREQADPGEIESPLLRELKAQLERDAQRAVEEAASNAAQSLKRVSEEAERQNLASAESLFERWKESIECERSAAREETTKSVAEQISGARDEIASHFTGQMAWAREEIRSDLKLEFTSHLDQVRGLVADLEKNAQALREEAGAVSSASDRMAQIKISLEAAEAAVDQRMRRMNDTAIQDSVLLEEMGVAWRGQLEEQMKSAGHEWDELLQTSLDGAAQRLASRLAEGSQSALEGAESKLSERIAQLAQPVTSAVSDARAALLEIRTSLDEELHRARTSLREIESAAERMTEFSSQMDAATHDAVNQLHRRLETALESQAAELRRQADAIAADMPQRIQPALDAAGQNLVARTLAELDARLTPHLEHVPELLRQLTAHEVQAEESLRMHRERLRQTAESSRRDAAAQLEQAFAGVRSEFEAARAEALAKWSEELSASGARAAHAAIEDLVKSAEWHKEEAKVHVEDLTQESLHRAEGVFEERTRAASESLGEELEKRKAVFAEGAQAQLETVAAGVEARSAATLAQASDAASKVFEERVNAIASGLFKEFEEAGAKALAEKETQVERISEKVRVNFEESAAGLLDRYRNDIAAHASQQLAEVRETHARELAAAVEAARLERAARDTESRENLARTHDEALRQYEETLQQRHEAWVNEAVDKLNQNGQIAVASLSRFGEQALRGSFLKIFEQIADSIRVSLAEPAGTNPEPKAMGAAASASSSAPPPMVNPSGAGHDSHAGN